MSGERTASRIEAAHMRQIIEQAVDALEDDGFERGQIGAAMLGIAGALVSINDGEAQAHRCLDAVRDAIAAQKPNA